MCGGVGAFPGARARATCLGSFGALYGASRQASIASVACDLIPYPFS
jgi:hypothetical protein